MDKLWTYTKEISIRISALIALLLVWELAPRLGIVDSNFVPPFSKVMNTIASLWVTEDLYMHIMSSIWRVLVGLLIAGTVGISLGFTLARWFERVYSAFEPLFRIFAKVNPFSLIPIFILFFGIGEGVKLAAVVWVCLWPILFATVSGVKSIDPLLIKAAVSMRASQFELICKVLFPGAVHSIFVGIRIGVEMSFFMLIAGEMLGANSGIGYLLHNGAHHSFDAPKLYACGFVIVIAGVILNRFLKYLQNGLFVWKEPVQIFKPEEDKERTDKIGKFEMVIVSSILVSIIILGSQQINKANIKAENPIENLTDEIQ